MTCENNKCIVKHDPERGGWFCFVCNERFIQLSVCAKCEESQADEQKPVETES